MKNTISLTFILLFASFNLYATNYYVSSSLGSNTNDGLSITTPWETLTKVYSFSLQPGDIVHFKRNDIWYNQFLSIKQSGTSSNPITYTDYGTGDLPIISGMGTLSNTAIWTNQGSDIWTITLDITLVPNWGYFYKLQRLYINGQEVLGAAKNFLSEVGTTVPDIVKFHYNQGTQLLTLHSTGNPNSLNIEFAFKQYALYFSWWANPNNFIEYINIENLKFVGGNISCVDIKAGQYVNLSSLDMGDKGNHGINISGSSVNTSKYVTVDNCLIDSRYTPDYTQAGTTLGLSDRGPREGFYGRWSDNVELKNSTIIGYTHANINLQHSSVGKNCEYYSIHDNYSTSSFAYGGRTVVDIGTYYLEFYNNTIDGSDIQHQLIGQNNHFHHNIIKNVRTSPIKHFHSGFGIAVYPYTGEDVLNNIYENNLIMDCESGGFFVSNYISSTDTASVSGCIFRNNILINNGKYISHFTAYPQNQTSNIDLAIKIVDPYDWSGATFINPITSNNLFQNNLLYVDGSQSGSNGSANILYHLDNNDPNGWSSTSITVAQFNLLNGQNNDVISSNIEGNPMFVDMANGDYHLLSTSPAINAGILPLATSDFEGNTTPFSGTFSDIGIYEFQEPSTNVESFNASSNLFVYPNPASNNAFIYNKENIKIENIKIYTTSGEIIYNNTGVANYINLEKLSKGVYFVKISTSENTLTQKLIIN